MANKDELRASIYKAVEAYCAADFGYARLHGDKELYVSGYTSRALGSWAATVRSWTDAGRDAFVYFDNDVKVRAPFDAMALAERLTRTASTLDAELVLLLEQQTDSYRTLDRRLGARRVLAQNEAHIQQMTDLLAFALCGPSRTALAEAVAAAAGLAGWQALDLGRADQAWLGTRPRDLPPSTAGTRL